MRLLNDGRRFNGGNLVRATTMWPFRNQLPWTAKFLAHQNRTQLWALLTQARLISPVGGIILSVNKSHESKWVHCSWHFFHKQTVTTLSHRLPCSVMLLSLPNSFTLQHSWVSFAGRVARPRSSQKPILSFSDELDEDEGMTTSFSLAETTKKRWESRSVTLACHNGPVLKHMPDAALATQWTKGVVPRDVPLSISCICSPECLLARSMIVPVTSVAQVQE